MADPKKPSSPFSSLAALQGALPAGPERPPEPVTAEPRGLDPYGAKITVAKTRKGRGGKTVTTITGLVGGAEVLEGIARELKHALGCGAGVEGGAIVVQGEHGPRVKAWLEARGAKRVVLGS